VRAASHSPDSMLGANTTIETSEKSGVFARTLADCPSPYRSAMGS
jgi:hypothetical protein